jgi:calcineurin-like phosphoesterase family protein
VRIFFTADCHFDHANIIKYCNRPFKNIDHMNEELVSRWNKVVSPGDLVYHLGDFAYKGSGPKFEKRLNGSIVHIMGNHDRNNGVKTILKYAIMEFGGMTIYATHIPPEEQKNQYEKNKEYSMIENCSIILCGHVHNNWKWRKFEDKYVINVGVDMWGFQPISISTILKLIASIKHGVK